LLKDSGELVTREQLRSQIWPEDRTAIHTSNLGSGGKGSP
jgi:hypothetical protein